jgi:hypothetical protein
MFAERCLKNDPACRLPLGRILRRRKISALEIVLGPTYPSQAPKNPMYSYLVVAGTSYLYCQFDTELLYKAAFENGEQRRV